MRKNLQIPVGRRHWLGKPDAAFSKSKNCYFHWLNIQYYDGMETTSQIWIAACAHELQRRWRTVEPQQLEEVAADLWRCDWLRVLPPDQAAMEWLRPVTTEN